MSVTSTRSKSCTRCSEVKSLEEFPPNKRVRDGRGSWCRSCAATHKMEWLAVPGNRELRKQQVRASYERQRTKDPKYFLYRTKLRKYGLTVAQYEEMLVSQEYRCASCMRELRERHATHVDHCHMTGTVRGILCRYCNVALGQLGDDPERVLALYQYVTRAKEDA